MITSGGNDQYAYVWDLETLVDQRGKPDPNGKPKRLLIPAVDAREWNARHPERYLIEEPKSQEA